MIDTKTTYSMPKTTMVYEESRSDKAFQIRENKRLILDMIPDKKFEYQIRSGMIVYFDVSLVLLMIQIKSNPSTAYHIWLNYFDEADRKCMMDISSKDTLNFRFINEREDLSRCFVISNNLLISYKIFLHDLRRKTPWSVEEFEYAKTNLIKKYPTPLRLWVGVQEMNYIGVKL